MDKKTKAGIIIRFVLLAVCILGVIIALSMNLDFLKEAGQNADNAGEAIGEVIGLALGAVIVLVIAFGDIIITGVVALIGLIFAARKIALSEGSVKTISIIQTVAFTACIITVLIKLLVLIMA